MNSLKDATIQVLFDRPMDQYSIYYTKEELKELEKDTAITEFLKDGVFADGNSIVYGYKKGEQQFYKNITISKNTVSGTSLLNCFGKPVLEQDGELLRIPVDRACLPDNYSKICVCIGDGFFSTEKNMALGIDKKIKMSESKIWMYQVGIQGDSTPLTAGTITLKKENQVLQLYKWNTDKTVIENLNQLKTLMNDEKKAFRIKTDASSFAQEEISLSVVVQEPNQDGSGPSDNFKLCYTRIRDGNYNEIALKQQTTREHIINYDTVEGQQTASFGAKNIKFQDIIGEGNSFEEGVYKLWFEFTDNCNNKSYYPSENEGDFILIVDEQVTKPEITGVHRDSYNSITIMLDSDSPMDKDITKFVLFINSETHSPAISEDHFSDQRITLTPFQYNPNTTYSFQINKTDFFGNQVFSNSYRTMIQ